MDAALDAGLRLLAETFESVGTQNLECIYSEQSAPGDRITVSGLGPLLRAPIRQSPLVGRYLGGGLVMGIGQAGTV
jgi:hypothetical protein